VEQNVFKNVVPQAKQSIHVFVTDVEGCSAEVLK
jgi:hypothetical protein